MTKENNDRFVLNRKILLKMLPFIKLHCILFSFSVLYSQYGLRIKARIEIASTPVSSRPSQHFASIKVNQPSSPIEQSKTCFVISADPSLSLPLSFSLPFCSVPPPSCALTRQSSLPLRRISDAISVIRGVPDISKERPLGSNHGKHCCATGRHSEVQSICFFFNL